jgi:tRNA(Ile2) C34 agmatinyltransferase TiaS
MTDRIAKLQKDVRRKYPFCPKCEYIITMSGHCTHCGWESPEYIAFKKEGR